MKKFATFCGIAVLSATFLGCGKTQVNVRARNQTDAEIIRNAIVREYPNLPDDQQKLIKDGLYFCGWYKEPGTSRFWGMGPEDDPEYARGDRTLYPKGTIKVNLSLTAMEIEQLAATVPDTRVRRVLNLCIRNVLVHEIEHVEEYMEQPVNDLSKTDPNECPDGLCDPIRLEGTHLKMRYEFRALRRNFVEVLSQIPQTDVDYAANWLQEHSSVLAGKQRLAGLPDRLRKLNIRSPFSNRNQVLFYKSMYFPAVLARKCAETGGLSEEDRQSVRAYVAFNKEKNNMLLDAYPYLKPVFHRLESCVVPLP